MLLACLNLPGVQRLDLLAYDLLLPTHAARSLPPLVIAIDDASLAELGRWPWPRSLHAQMIDHLREAGAQPVGMAVLFSEPDLDHPEEDAALALAIDRHGRVVLASAPAQTTDGHIHAPPLRPVLPTHTPVALGHVDVEIDLDGQSRSLYLQAGNASAHLPTLALAMQHISQPAPKTAPVPLATASTWVRSQEVLLPRVSGLPVLSFASALRAPEQLAIAHGRAVFIGITASGLGGELATPLAGSQNTLPAVLLHAQTYAALNDLALMQRAPSPWRLLLAVLALGSLALWPAPNGRRTLLAVLLLALPVLVSAGALAATRYWVPPAVPTLGLAVGLLLWLADKLQAMAREQQRARQLARSTLQAIDDAVLTIDARSHTIQFANPTARTQAGGQPLQGKKLTHTYPLTAGSMARLDAALDTCIQSRTRIHLPELLHLQTPAGIRALRATASPLGNPHGLLEGVVLVLSDVTDAVAVARLLDHAAHHDALTGLPNRVMLQERLAQALSRLQRRGGSAAVLFLDLDRFKHINDSLGHSTGDAVLKVIAQRLRALCRDTDTVARWGGDEFVLVLEDVGGQEGAAIAAAKVIEALSQDIELDASFGHLRLPSAGSVGVVMAPQDGNDMESLLSKADMAMYRAKAQPQASFHFWANDINTHVHERLAMELALRQSLQDDQLVLHYQPQFAFDDQRLVGMEALMRWQRTPDQLLMPSDFLGVAEDCGLIVDMGNWAVLQAARQIARWLRAGQRAVPIAVNLSARQCLNRDIVQVVRSALQETGIPPALLRLEITETTAMTDADHVIGLLRDIRALGVGLAVDDFGTGYSSLAYLKRFPIDELKIDRSFIHDIATDKDDAAIVRATIALAHGLGLKVVAEGVETEEQSRLLAAQRCDTAQGYLYGRPQAIVHATTLL